MVYQGSDKQVLPPTLQQLQSDHSSTPAQTNPNRHAQLKVKITGICLTFYRVGQNRICVYAHRK